MKCLNCNNELTENMQICPVCGFSVNSTINNINEISNPGIGNVEIPVMNNEIVSPPNQNQVNALHATETLNNIGVNNTIISDNNVIVEQLDRTDNVVINNPQPFSNDVNIELESNININSPLNSNIVEQPIAQPVEQSMVQPNTVNNNIMAQPVIENNIKNNNEGTQTNKQKNFKIIIPVILIAIIVISLIIGGLFFLKPSPKKMYTTIIDGTFDRVLMGLNNEKYTSNTVTTEFSVKPLFKTIDQEYKELFDLISKIDIKGKYQIDYINKNILLDLDSKYDKKDLINGNVYISNNKIYANLEEIYDRYITEDIEGFNEVFDILKHQKDTKIILEELRNAIKKSLKDEYFISEKVKMNIKGKETSVNKTTLLLNYDNTMNLIRDILTSLKSNDKYLDSVINITNSYSSLYMTEEITKEELIKQIEETKEETKEEPDSKEGEIRINIFTKGLKNDFVGVEMTVKDEYEDSKISLINDKENTYTLTIKSDDEEFILPIKEENDSYTLEFSEDGVKLTMSANFKTNEYKFDMTTEELTLTGNYTITKDKMTGKILVKDEGTEMGLETTFTNKFNETVSLPTFNNTIKAENITEEERTNILSKLMEKDGIKEIIDLYSNMNQSYEDDYYYNNDYGYDYDTENINYNTFDNYNDFNSVVNDNNINMIVLGRDSCRYCNMYLSVFDSVANEHDIEIYYINSEKMDESVYQNIINGNLVVPARCNSTNKDFKLSEGFGTPLTIFTKQGKVEDCISGYVDEYELLDKLDNLGMLNNVY